MPPFLNHDKVCSLLAMANFITTSCSLILDRRSHVLVMTSLLSLYFVLKEKCHLCILNGAFQSTKFVRMIGTKKWSNALLHWPKRGQSPERRHMSIAFAHCATKGLTSKDGP